jgi:hypothetical protein
MKAVSIFILTLLFTLSTLTGSNAMVGGIEKTSEESVIDFEENYQYVDIETEDDKIYTQFPHTLYYILAARVEDKEETRFQYTIHSLLKPPEAFLA